MKKIQFWMFATLLCGLCFQISCSNKNYPSPNEKKRFENEMTAALADARVYGPPTQALAQEVAERFNGRVTDLNYKTRESATRKCVSNQLRPYELRDLARTTIAAGWDSLEIKPVISYLVETSTERNLFGCHRHQTSDYGYWGDVVNLKFERLVTEIQVKTYGMFYASYPEEVAHGVLGDSIYTIIRTSTGAEPGLSHYYYEIIRSDTSSAATVEHYKQLTNAYYALFEHILEPLDEPK